MKAIVTGANGLIGANLVRELIRQGHQVRALVRQGSDIRNLANLEVEISRGDVCSADSVAAASVGCEILFHTAAIFAYWGHSHEQLRWTAVQGTTAAIDGAARSGVRRVVLTSSSVVFGSSAVPAVRDENSPFDDPDPPAYARSKYLQEQAASDAAARAGIELVAVHPTITVGPHDYRIGTSNAIVLNYLLDPSRSTFIGGCNVVSVRDVAAGHILAALHGKPFGRYLLAGENLRWAELHAMISSLSGTWGPGVTMNHTMSYLAAAALEVGAWFTNRTPPSTREQAKMVGRYYWYRHDRAAELGYSPRSARRAIAAATAWLLDHPNCSSLLRATLRPAEDVRAERAEHAEGAGIGDTITGAAR